MFNLRENIFETNSSSTHSMTICTQSEYNKWKNKEIYFVKPGYLSGIELNKYFLSEEELRDIIKQVDSNSAQNDDIQTIFDKFSLRNIEYYILYEDSYDDGENGVYHYYETYTTPSGENLVIFGEFYPH